MEAAKRLNFDTIIFVFAALFFAVSTFLILDEKIIFKFGKKNYENLQTVGSMGQTSNDIRRRLATDFAWFPSYQLDHLYLGDSIFSGAQSDAKINLLDGGNISLDENTLIRLEKTTEQMILNLIVGSISNTIGVGKTMRFKVGDKIHEITGDGVEIKIKRDQEGSLTITVKKGTAQIATILGSQILKQTLNENQVLRSNATTLGYAIHNLTNIALAPKIAPSTPSRITLAKPDVTEGPRRISKKSSKKMSQRVFRKKRIIASVQSPKDSLDESLQESKNSFKKILKGNSNKSKQPVSTAPEEGWTIKVATYTNKDDAWNKVNELRTKGLIPYYTVTNQDGQLMFLVNIGLFGNRAEADAFAVKLKSELQNQDNKTPYQFAIIKAD